MHNSPLTAEGFNQKEHNLLSFLKNVFSISERIISVFCCSRACMKHQAFGRFFVLEIMRLITILLPC